MKTMYGMIDPTIWQMYFPHEWGIYVVQADYQTQIVTVKWNIKLFHGKEQKTPLCFYQKTNVDFNSFIKDVTQFQICYLF